MTGRKTMTGRSVLIVGGSSGIGLATALRLGAEGDRLTLMARSPEAAAPVPRRRCCSRSGPRP
jgi:NAD(P)-dependent dehydrogenase (short-subunit alcohol dehydrogenase family)